MKPESSVINVYGTKNISIAELHKMGSSSLRNINNVNIEKRLVDLEKSDLQVVIPIRPYRERLVSGHLQDLTDLEVDNNWVVGILSDDSLFKIFHFEDEDFFDINKIKVFFNRLQDGYYKTFIGIEDDITKRGINFLEKVYKEQTIRNTWWFDGHAWPGHFNAYLYDLSIRKKNIKFVKLKDLSSMMLIDYLTEIDNDWKDVKIDKINDKSKIKEQLVLFAKEYKEIIPNSNLIGYLFKSLGLSSTEEILFREIEQIEDYFYGKMKENLFYD